MKRTAWFYLAAMLLLPLWPASATVVRYIGLSDLTRSSHIIVDATVLSQRTLTRNGEKNVLTETTLWVNRVFKGMLSKRTVTLTQLGGISGRYGRRVSGSPRFRLGQRMVVFLYKNPRGPMVVNGLELGVFRVAQDATKQLMVSQKIREVVMYRRLADGRSRIYHRGIIQKPERYESFVTRVRGLIAAGKR